MVKRLTKHYANFAATVALATALIGVGAVDAARDLVTSGDVKNNSLTGNDIKNRSITGRDLRGGGVPLRALASSTVDELQATPATSQVAASEQIGGFNRVEVSVPCPEGQVATGGGGELLGTPWRGQVRRSAPILDAEGVPRGWAVWMFNEDNLPDQARVYAICSP